MTEPQLNQENIQGNILAGFNKDHQWPLADNGKRPRGDRGR